MLHHRVSTGILQLLGVRKRLVLVQKDRVYMKELAKKEAFLQGRKALNNLDWYDYSGCRKNMYSYRPQLFFAIEMFYT